MGAEKSTAIDSPIRLPLKPNLTELELECPEPAAEPAWIGSLDIDCTFTA